LRFFAATVVGAAPATFVYSYLGERAPMFVQVLLVALGAVIAGAVVAVVVRCRKQGKLGRRVPPRRARKVASERRSALSMIVAMDTIRCIR
jgi:hypothetical protein